MNVFLGILSPKDIESASATANIVKSFSIPIGAFSSGAAEKFIDANIENIIVTAPLIYNYVEVFKIFNKITKKLK